MAMKSMEGLSKRMWLLTILVLGMGGCGVPVMVSADNDTYGSGTYGIDLYNGSTNQSTTTASTTSTSTGGGPCTNCDSYIQQHSSSGSSGGGSHSFASTTVASSTTPSTSSAAFYCPDTRNSADGLSTAGLVNLFVSLGIIPSDKAQKACDALASQTATQWSISNTAFRFTKPLKMGNRSADVKQLQLFLNTHGYVVTSSGDGSPGHETDYFGVLTFNAVKRFQQAYAAEILAPVGLTAPSGFFGPSTMKQANAVLAGA